MKRTLLTPLLSLSMLAGGLSCQAADAPVASPRATLKQNVGFTDITIDYSRPGAKDRTMLGGQLAYGEVWRTGANAATALTFSTGVKLNGHDVPAGQYYLFTIPGESEWSIILLKELAEDFRSSYGYHESKEFARFSAKPQKLTEHVETLTIGINDIRDFSATLNIDWEHTRVPIRLELPEKKPAA